MMRTQSNLPLIDAMGLVLILAPGMAISASLVRPYSSLLLTSLLADLLVGKKVIFVMYLLSPCVLTLGGGLLCLSIRDSRAARLPIPGKPGLMACFASTTISCIYLSHKYILYHLFAPGRWRANLVWELMDGSVLAIGSGVAGAWTTLLVLGKWNLERSWKEELGIVCGVFWILMMFAHEYKFYGL